MSDLLTTDDLNLVSPEVFVKTLGFLFEHSPWIVEAVALYRPFADRQALYLALMDVVTEASHARRLELLRAHPRLADKVAQADGLTEESAAEQASAGLDKLSPDEFSQFHALNAAYDRRFGFPFIICVRMTGGKAGILNAMRHRLDNNRETELATALAEVGKIVWLRLNDVVRA